MLSGDEVDVFFQSGLDSFLVEVKSKRSNDADLERGVYQCIKYRAVFLAQCRTMMPDLKVLPVLVIEVPPPPKIKALAALHKVRIVTLKVND